MNTKKSLKIINMLADGVDPHTGEKFPLKSTYQQPDIVRALHAAIRALERVQELEDRREPNGPGNAGCPWDKAEERRMAQAFEAGKSIGEIAKKHKRTEGAIRARLIKLGYLAE